ERRGRGSFASPSRWTTPGWRRPWTAWPGPWGADCRVRRNQGMLHELLMFWPLEAGVRNGQKRDAGNHGERGASRSLRTGVSFLFRLFSFAIQAPFPSSRPMTDRRKRARRMGQESPLSATWRPAVREKAVLVGLGRRYGES